MSRLKLIDLIIYRSAAELKTEGQRTYAGYLWWILEPLLSLAVYYVAFKYIFHHQTENFAVFLFIGIVNYRFFAGTVTRSAVSISGGQGLIQLVYVHKSLFPLTVVMVNVIKFLITFLLVLVAVWLVGIMPAWSYLVLPVLFFLMVLCTAGISMICAAITPFFPDFQLILGTIMQLLIFLSGVFFDVGQLSQPMQSVIRLNPLAVINEQCRIILLSRQWPDLLSLTPAMAESMIAVAIGGLLLHRLNRYYPKLG